MGKSEPKSRITEQDRAVLGLKQQRDKLNQYKKRIEGNLDKERQVAKELLKHNKRDKARTLLKKKRYQENLLSQCDGQLDSIQQLIDSLEFAQVQLQVVEKLKLGNESLKKLNSLMSVEEVERIMEETREAVEYQAEIDSLLSGAGLTSEDEEAVQAELHALMATEESPPSPIIDSRLPTVPTTDPSETITSQEPPLLPDVPNSEPGAKEQQRVGKQDAVKKKTAVLAS